MMTDTILQALTKTLTQVRAEMQGKPSTAYDVGYIDGLLRACEAVQQATKEAGASCAK